MASPQSPNQLHDQVVLKSRLPRETKVRLAALARRRGLNQSSLIRQLIADALAESRTERSGKVMNPSETRVEPRVAVRLSAADLRAIRTRAAARKVTVRRYLAALVRAHLKNDFRPLAAEMAMMRELVSRLNAIGVELNHLVRAASEGAVWAGAIKEVLELTVGEFEKLGVRISEFENVNRKGWETSGFDDDSRLEPSRDPSDTAKSGASES